MAAKPLHHGPILPLAIMAMFALMIPIFAVANSKSQNIQNSNAAGLRMMATSTPRPTSTPSTTKIYTPKVPTVKGPTY